MGNSQLTAKATALGRKDAKADAVLRTTREKIALAERLLADQAKLEADRQDAAARKEALINKALLAGGDRRDPWHTLCVCAAWGVRPIVKGNRLMVSLPATESARKMFVQVGEIYFSPLGGIRGLRVVDAVGDQMICDGDCVSRGRWSHMTRGFWLLDDKGHV